MRRGPSPSAEVHRAHMRKRPVPRATRPVSRHPSRNWSGRPEAWPGEPALEPYPGLEGATPPVHTSERGSGGGGGHRGVIPLVQKKLFCAKWLDRCYQISCHAGTGDLFTWGRPQPISLARDALHARARLVNIFFFIFPDRI